MAKKKSTVRQAKVDQICELCSDADCSLSTLQRLRSDPETERRIREMRVELTAVMESLLDWIDPDSCCEVPEHLIRDMAANVDDSDVHNVVALDLGEQDSRETVGAE